MSRGLGIRQRQFLAALAALEVSAGVRSFTTAEIVSAAFDQAGVKDEFAEMVRLRDEAERRARVDEMAFDDAVTLVASTGDKWARERVKQGRYLRMLGDLIRSRRRWGGRRQQRAKSHGEVSPEALLNPSRVLAELKDRGLINSRFRGYFFLTAAGREILRTIVPTLKDAGSYRPGASATAVAGL